MVNVKGYELSHTQGIGYVSAADGVGCCAQLAQAYQACLKEHNANAQSCRELSKQYLQCRMERWVMQEPDVFATVQNTVFCSNRY